MSIVAQSTTPVNNSGEGSGQSAEKRLAKPLFPRATITQELIDLAGGIEQAYILALLHFRGRRELKPEGNDKTQQSEWYTAFTVLTPSTLTKYYKMDQARARRFLQGLVDAGFVEVRVTRPTDLLDDPSYGVQWGTTRRFKLNYAAIQASSGITARKLFHTPNDGRDLGKPTAKSGAPTPRIVNRTVRIVNRTHPKRGTLSEVSEVVKKAKTLRSHFSEVTHLDARSSLPGAQTATAGLHSDPFSASRKPVADQLSRAEPTRAEPPRQTANISTGTGFTHAEKTSPPIRLTPPAQSGENSGTQPPSIAATVAPAVTPPEPCTKRRAAKRAAKEPKPLTATQLERQQRKAERETAAAERLARKQLTAELQPFIADRITGPYRTKGIEVPKSVWGHAHEIAEAASSEQEAAVFTDMFVHFVFRYGLGIDALGFRERALIIKNLPVLAVFETHDALRSAWNEMARVAKAEKKEQFLGKVEGHVEALMKTKTARDLCQAVDVTGTATAAAMPKRSTMVGYLADKAKTRGFDGLGPILETCTSEQLIDWWVRRPETFNPASLVSSHAASTIDAGKELAS